MSFYLGKDNSTNYILHTTNIHESEETMRSGVLDSTTFHSSLPYLQLFYEDTIQLKQTTKSFQGGSLYRYSAMFSNKSIDLILEGYLYSIVVNTANSGNQDCAIPGMSTSFMRVGTSPSFENRSPSYAWGSTDSPYTWGDTNKHPYPSYTNRYADITSYTFSYDTKAAIMSSGAKDTLNSTTGRVVFYNIKNNNLITQSATAKVLITPNQFTIDTPTQTINMSNFEPFRVCNSSSIGAFKANGLGNLYLKPVTRSKFSTVKWEIDSEISSNCIINKYTSDGTKHNIIGNGLRNLVFSRVVTFPYSLTATNNTVTSPGFMTIGNDEVATVIVDGSFSNSVIGTTFGNGAVPFVSNAAVDYLASIVETTRVRKGVYHCDAYLLYVSVQNGTIFLKHRDVRWCSGSSITGTFSGTLKVYIFKIK